MAIAVTLPTNAVTPPTNAATLPTSGKYITLTIVGLNEGGGNSPFPPDTVHTWTVSDDTKVDFINVQQSSDYTDTSREIRIKDGETITQGYNVIVTCSSVFLNTNLAEYVTLSSEFTISFIDGDFPLVTHFISTITSTW